MFSKKKLKCDIFNLLICNMFHFPVHTLYVFTVDIIFLFPFNNCFATVIVTFKCNLPNLCNGLALPSVWNSLFEKKQKRGQCECLKLFVLMREKNILTILKYWELEIYNVFIVAS
jgi:hypothetical protein